MPGQCCKRSTRDRSGPAARSAPVQRRVEGGPQSAADRRGAPPVPRRRGARNRRVRRDPRPSGPRRIARKDRETPKVARIWFSTCVPAGDCPPIAKKSSSLPTRSTRSRVAKMPVSTSSVGERGGPLGSTQAVPPSAGIEEVHASRRRCLRSSLPFVVSGSSASAIQRAGTMYSGSLAATAARSRATSGVAPCGGTTKAASCLPPDAVSVATTAAA